MTIAHLSDTHLGFRAYARCTPQGFNQREHDVMVTFKACLDAIAERDPDLVIHSGDMFHVVRPSNATIVEAYRSLDAFQRRRGHKPLVLIGGNHDTPRTADSGNLLKLFTAIPGVHIKTGNAEYLDDPALADLGVEILCVPSNSLISGEKIDYTPQSNRKHGVLVLHGLAQKLIQDHADFEIASTNQDKWTYVALGDYHVYKAYGPNICYAGSTDFTSTNIWEEAKHEKCWIWFDSANPGLEKVCLRTRAVIDLTPIDALDLSPEELTDRLMAQATWNESSMPLVRQRITNVRPEVRQRVGVSVLRELGARALNYQVQMTAPLPATSGSNAARGPGVSLEQSWSDHVAHSQLPGGVARPALEELGLKLLREVAERETAPTEA